MPGIFPLSRVAGAVDQVHSGKVLGEVYYSDILIRSIINVFSYVYRSVLCYSDILIHSMLFGYSYTISERYSYMYTYNVIHY
jgi:hypothetical protein